MAICLLLKISHSQTMARMMCEDFWDLSSQIFQPVCENEGFEIARHRLLAATPHQGPELHLLFDPLPHFQPTEI